jgi:hypothetical protein
VVLVIQREMELIQRVMLKCLVLVSTLLIVGIPMVCLDMDLGHQLDKLEEYLNKLMQLRRHLGRDSMGLIRIVNLGRLAIKCQ